MENIFNNACFYVTLFIYLENIYIYIYHDKLGFILVKYKVILVNVYINVMAN